MAKQKKSYTSVYILSIARHAIHLQFDISTNALEIRAVQSQKCIEWSAVNCTYYIWCIGFTQTAFIEEWKNKRSDDFYIVFPIALKIL
jgi:hypothetical protein